MALASTKRNGRVVVFDVETTGTDPRRDQVIELCVQFGLDERSLTRTWRIRPDVEISAGAQAVHGICAEDLVHCPRFVSLASRLRAVFDWAEVLVGYNLSFDIEMLQAEFARLRQPELKLENKKIIDAFRLWQRCEPRSLQDAHRRFVGDSFDAAHSAAADVAATGRVLSGMLGTFELATADWTTIAHVCEPDRARWLGSSRHIQYNEQGEVIVGFGRYAGTLLSALVKDDNGSYLRWILEKDFPAHVQQICRQALELSSDRFHAWIATTFAPPQSETSEPLPEAVQQASA